MGPLDLHLWCVLFPPIICSHHMLPCTNPESPPLQVQTLSTGVDIIDAADAAGAAAPQVQATNRWVDIDDAAGAAAPQVQTTHQWVDLNDAAGVAGAAAPQE
ncbi:hypothetical protein NDU88_007617 [Pleurodeles waltl]|uniref:Uncharacterized protein n=1 Tax=Pleurodeles waltl TaxID=8319 RepID=A0AAV7SSX3_PLEWA|nr:hypothetical protein NDU88_007617 [Pleurodeles waltl]